MKRFSDPLINVFKDYLSFLNEYKELETDEAVLCNTIAHEFIRLVENTRMTKVYKMPLLLAFYNKGNMKLKLTRMTFILLSANSFLIPQMQLI